MSDALELSFYANDTEGAGYLPTGEGGAVLGDRAQSRSRACRMLPESWTPTAWPSVQGTTVHSHCTGSG